MDLLSYIPCRSGPTSLHLTNLYFADIAPDGTWADIELVPPCLRNDERERLTLLVIEVGVGQNSIVRANN